MIKCYSELITLPTFAERFEYLKLDGKVGSPTFAAERYLNQAFYNSWQWRHDIRPKIIVRDGGRDMGLEGFNIFGQVLIHHINPITIEDIENMSNAVYDPENLICVAYDTHQAIHYGDGSKLLAVPQERKPFDTCPWRIQ